MAMRSIGKIVCSLILLFLTVKEVHAQPKKAQVDSDFARGELAYTQKNYPQAVTLFEKLTRSEPENARAHYWLGASLYAAGDPERARDAFRRVVEIGEPAAFVPKAKRYLRLIEGEEEDPAQKAYEVNVSTGVRYDSNLLLDTEPLNLVQDQSAFAWDVSLHGAFFPIRKENFLFGLEYSFFNALYEDLDDFSFNWHRAGGIFAGRWDHLRAEFKPSFSATFVEYGSDRYEILGQFPLALRYAVSDWTETEAFYRFEIEEFSNVGTPTFSVTASFLRDNLAHVGGLSQYFYFLQKKGYLNLGVEVHFEDARNPYDLWGPRIFGRLGGELPMQFLLEVYGSFYYKDYFHDDLPDIAFVPNGIQREDLVTQVGIRARKTIVGPLWAQAGYEFWQNDSNELLFDYVKHLGQFSVGVDF